MKNALLMFLLLAVAALPAAAQDKKEKTQLLQTPESYARKIFQLKYAEARSLASLLAIFGYPVQPDTRLKAIAVSAPPEGMAAIEEAIKRLDAPSAEQKDIDLTVYLLIASDQASASSDIPAALQPVINQLKSVFAYKGFRLLDTLLLRTLSGIAAEATGIVAVGPSGAPKTSYQFRVTPSGITTDPNGRSVRLDNLRLGLRVPVEYKPGGFSFQDAGLSTDITVREGQRVVVGKSSLGGPDQALVLVLSAKVVE